MQHTLLVLIGRSPQVVTESVYAFYKESGICFDNIICVTTKCNKQNIVESLLGTNGKLKALEEDYKLPSISFTESDILIPENEGGNAIADVKSPEEMAAMSEYLLNLVQTLTSQGNKALHASLAGGRKTMTFFLSYAMSVYGRQHDTLTHVFVPTEYERSEFYYPTPCSQMIEGPTGSLDAKNATVQLAHIPYVQLRDNIPKKLLDKRVTVADTEEVYRVINAPVALEIDLPNKQIRCSGKEIQLSISNLTYYLLMVDDVLNANEGFDSPTDSQPCQTMALLYLNKRLEVEGSSRQFAQLHEAVDYIDANLVQVHSTELEGLAKGMKKSFFNQRKNEINKQLGSELPQVVAEHYDIDSISSVRREGSSKPVNFFGLQIDKSLIKFKGL